MTDVSSRELASLKKSRPGTSSFQSRPGPLGAMTTEIDPPPPTHPSPRCMQTVHLSSPSHGAKIMKCSRHTALELPSLHVFQRSPRVPHRLRDVQHPPSEHGRRTRIRRGKPSAPPRVAQQRLSAGEWRPRRWSWRRRAGRIDGCGDVDGSGGSDPTFTAVVVRNGRQRRRGHR